MAFLVALALAVFVLPSPWGAVAVVVGGLVEIGEAILLWRWSHRRAPAVGLDSLVGVTAVAVTACRPLGQVRVKGEIWQARCEEGVEEGTGVRIVGVDGLTLIVEPA